MKQLDISNAEIKFENVDFGYVEDRQVLHDVSFEVLSGQKVAIVAQVVQERRRWFDYCFVSTTLLMVGS